MDAILKYSPLKRKSNDDGGESAGAAASSASKKPAVVKQRGNPDWPCIDFDNCLYGRLKTVPRTHGGFFIVCDHNVRGDDSTCNVTLTLLKASEHYPKKCTLCLRDVGGSPSIGTKTDEEQNGYPVYDNLHGVLSYCVWAKTSDGKFFKNATPATSAHTTQRCICADENDIAESLESGCTGTIAEGDLLVKDWNPPLHLLCARRVWHDKIKKTLHAKNNIRDLDTTAEKEAAQPSAEVPEHLQ